MNEQRDFLDAFWVPDTDEDLMRRHRALAYSTRVEFRRLRRERKVERAVSRLFATAVVAWLFAVALVMWTRWLM